MVDNKKHNTNLYLIIGICIVLLVFIVTFAINKTEEPVLNETIVLNETEIVNETIALNETLEVNVTEIVNISENVVPNNETLKSAFIPMNESCSNCTDFFEAANVSVNITK